MTLLDTQRALAAAGHDPGPLDGIGGAKTAAALRAWLATSGLPANVTATRDRLTATWPILDAPPRTGRQPGPPPPAPAPVMAPSDQPLTHWDERSARNLVGIRADLRAVVERTRQILAQRAEPPTSMTIIDGMRTVAEQVDNVRRRVSKTLHSAHLVGAAIDFSPNPVRRHLASPAHEWKAVADAFKQASAELGTPIEWGGDWGWDSPHIQLHSKIYPWRAEADALLRQHGAIT